MTSGQAYAPSKPFPTSSPPGFIRAVALDVIVVAMWMTLTVVEEAA
jgi:hypothetical protein